MDIKKLDSHIYKPYEEELAQMRQGLMRMGGLVEKQLFDAIRAVDDVDSGIAETVLSVEEEIDRLDIELEEQGMQIIARRQPVASDLRVILGTRRCVGELERIGDEAKKIARMAIKLASGGVSPEGYRDIRSLSVTVAKMLSDSLDAFSRLDVDTALTIIDKDDEVDETYQTALKELMGYMAQQPENIASLMNVVWVLRSLERIGDHAQNICEAIVYIVRGKDIRHGRISDLEQ